MRYNLEQKHILYLLVIFTFYNLFFLNKAFHIDDPFTIEITKSLKANFLKPQGFFSNPPFLGYYYLPILKIFGEKEAAFHFFSLPFSLLAILSMYFLAKRFITDVPIWPVVLFISTPAFIITSHSVMLDMPQLALFLSALAAFIYGTDKEDKKLLFLSGLLTSAAILIKYSALLLIPICLIYSTLFLRKRSSIFLVLPLTVFVLWNIMQLFIYGQPIFLNALMHKLHTFLSADKIFIRTIVCLVFISQVSLVTLFITPFLVGRKRINRRILLLSIPLGLCPFYIRNIFLGYSLLEKFILSLFILTSVFIIAIVFKPILNTSALISLTRRQRVAAEPRPLSVRNAGEHGRGGSVDRTRWVSLLSQKDDLFLALWFFIMLFFVILIQFISARFVLLIFPSLFLIVYKEIMANIELLPKKIFILLVAISLFVSTVFAVGDYYFANIYREAASILKKRFSGRQDTVFFMPAGWEYDYYMDKENFQFLDVMRQSKNGDVFLIVPSEQPLPTPEYRNKLLETLSEKGIALELNDTIEYKGRIFLHNKKFHAGFYSHDWGLFPFTFSFKECLLERFSIYRLASLNN